MDLIQGYGSDEDEERSPSEAGDSHPTPPNARDALPDAEHVLGVGPAVDTDPHQGRARQFPHVEGQFNVHVFFAVGLSDKAINGINRLVGAVAESSAGLALHAVAPGDLHISFARPFTLQRGQIVPFVSALEKSLRRCSRFRLSAKKASVLSNDSQTRYFLTVLTDAPGAAEAEYCQRALNSVDSVLAAFEKEPFYRPAQLHFSVAWSLQAFDVAGVVLGEAAEALIDCAQLTVKAGTREYTIALRA